MNNVITKLWTRVPGTGYPTWNPTQPLTYVMGSYTLTAKYRNAWNHKGRYTMMVDHYVLHGPGYELRPEQPVSSYQGMYDTLGDAKQQVMCFHQANRKLR